MARHPINTLKSIKDLLSSPSAVLALGKDEVNRQLNEINYLIASYSDFDANLTDYQAELLGIRTGRFVTGVVELAAGAGGAVKSVAQLTEKLAAKFAVRDAINVATEITHTPFINRAQELQELFNLSHSRSGIQIGNRTLLEMPRTGNAKIFSGATDAEVKQYFTEITGKALPPVKPLNINGVQGEMYVVNTPYGNVTLRNVSSSLDQTGPTWTIRFPEGMAAPNGAREVKFLRGAQ